MKSKEIMESKNMNTVELVLSKKVDLATTKFLRSLTSEVNREEVRFLVDLYYQIQDRRITLQNQIRSLEQGFDHKSDNSSYNILKWSLENAQTEEKSLKNTLDAVVTNTPVGDWLKSIVGIGPVFTAGLMANLDIEKANYATHFISYAGLNDNNRPWISRADATKIVNDVLNSSNIITEDHLEELAKRTKWHYSVLLEKCTVLDKNNNPTGKRSKEKLISAICMTPYNANLKTLCWLIGESFVKVSGNPSSLYGKLYRERKVYETTKNEAGEYAEYAALQLKTKNYSSKKTGAYDAYTNGILPDAHITSRCKRYAVKIFLSHLFEEMYREHYKKIPAGYYTIDKLGHKDIILPEVPYTC